MGAGLLGGTEGAAGGGASSGPVLMTGAAGAVLTTGGGAIGSGGGAMVTLEGSFSGAAGGALPVCGPTKASALALSSGDTESLPACDAVGVLLAPLSAFMLLAISTPPAMATTMRASTAHLIQALLLRTGSCGKAGGLSLRAGKAGALTAAVGAVGAAGKSMGLSMGSISGGSVRAIDAEDAAGTAGMAAAAVAAALASNTEPHLGQNLACGLQIAWHCGQVFSAFAARAARSSVAGGRACRVPQRLQNLAFAASALPH